MNKISRREFVRRGAVVTGTIAAGGVLLPKRGIGEVLQGGIAIQQVPLGKTGIKVSRLGMGTGTVGWNHQSNQTRLGLEAFTALARHAYECGITYFDAADMYGSHTYLRDALKGIPRDRLTLSTKIEWNVEEGPAKAVERFLREFNTEYLDMVVLHCVRQAEWDKQWATYMDALTTAKEKKLVRAVGVSCHSVESLRTAAKSPWVDVVLARINHRGEKMDAKPEIVVPALREIHDAGKALVGMKIAGEGRLVNELDTSLKYVLGLDCVDAMIVGFEQPSQIDDTMSRMNRLAQS